MWWWISLICFAICFGSQVPTHSYESYDQLLSSVKQSKLVQVSRVYKWPVTHVAPQVVADAISGFFDVVVRVDVARRVVLYRATASEHREIYKLITSLDQPAQQLQFDVQIIEVNTARVSQFQSLLTSLTDGYQVNYDPVAGALVDVSPLMGVIQASISDGSSKVLANPQLVVRDGQEGDVHVGDQIPYITTALNSHGQSQTVTYVDTGIVLKVAPKMDLDDRLVIDIDAQVSSIVSWQEFGASRVPVLANRQVQTSVLMQKDQTVVLAGLYDDVEQEVVSRVPVLGWIPILGRLFRREYTQTRQNDVLFVIRPRNVEFGPSDR